MKATLTKTAPVQNSRRRSPGRNIVYVSSPFDDIADEFATKNGIWNLPFKCKTWTGVCREATKINANALKELFPEAVSIKFSQKAGCTCGCSSGYIVKTNSTQLDTNNWVTIEATQVEQDVFRASIFSLRREVELKEEIAQNAIATVS
jgi:hypothetical protein